MKSTDTGAFSIEIAPLTDAEEEAINRGIALDPDAPEMTEAALRRAVRGRPKLGEAKKIRVQIRLDPDVVAEARRQAPEGYTRHINDTLRKAFGLD